MRADADGDLLARMAALNTNLRAYTATMHASVALQTFPFLSANLVGTLYHKEPNLDKLEITSGLPGIAKQFSKLYPRVESPSHWDRVFVVTLTRDDGTTAAFKLVPRKPGNVDHIDVVVDDKSATVSSMTWHYGNGGTATMNLVYAKVGDYLLATTQSGQVDEPGYKAAITSTLSDYKINPALPDSVFAQ